MTPNLEALKAKLLAIPEMEWFSAPVYKLFRQHGVEVLNVDDMEAEDVTPIFAVNQAHEDREVAITTLFHSTDDRPVLLTNGVRVAVWEETK